ncbi:hypothetical protein A4H97_25835 [Niastella yeongjuensis]|uniref:Secretion system C-terminal sorting domain-containing protein n=1 Tax=Niastella yeongjuensis TaxID=354355 RepID=A0A1V9F104_9BACT|nr:carboxypeptidase-like regulatory domain-containing protein [Niastella yeongjuensis]OQP52038.1 hypothetical protein A4H97_25835 [Niastella yeongjuensis]SEP36837.1 Por secretion system C-terminal sorting domain-containing protein [Niastella yeongjuensis]
MPKSLLLNIPEPCHENWQNMTPQEQGRFCGSCQKVVVDFSVMTDKEVLDYFSKASQHVCGRFSNDQLNKEMTITPTKKRVTWAYVWNVLVASVLVTKTYAQGKPQIKKQPVDTTINERSQVVGWTSTKLDPVETVIPVTVKGVVLDAQTNLPVMGTSVTIKGTKIGSSANASGNFQLQVDNKNGLELEVSRVGYEKQTMQLDKIADLKNVQILIKPAIEELETATVIAYASTTKRVFWGGAVSKSYSLTNVEKIKRAVNTLIPAALKNDIKVYPNPVMRGNNIQAKLNLPLTGKYNLELLNTAGQVMLTQPLYIQTKGQLIDLYTQTNWSAGIYWLRISSTKMKNVFEARVLLQ